jgi:hypothetical protein
MTEQEAKAKWCPFVRLIAETERTHPMNNREERLDGDRDITNCIGSACMAWRWHTEPTEKREFYTMGKKPDGDGWRCTLSEAGREGFSVKSRWERNVPREGHCGLAGTP